MVVTFSQLAQLSLSPSTLCKIQTVLQRPSFNIRPERVCTILCDQCMDVGHCLLIKVHITFLIRRNKLQNIRSAILSNRTITMIMIFNCKELHTVPTMTSKTEGLRKVKITLGPRVTR